MASLSTQYQSSRPEPPKEDITTTEILYDSLDHSLQQIRLLRLTGSSGSDHDYMLHFDLETISLADVALLEYSAISYSWGRNTAMADIGINGKSVKVPASAEGALRGILFSVINWSVSRDPGNDDQVAVKVPRLWLNAICINQLDLVEKSEQVSMMGEIYSGAEATLIWLGDDDGTTSQAFKDLDSIGRDCIRWFPKVPGHGDVQAFVDEARQHDFSFKPFPQFDMPAFKSLLDCEWFTRLWVIPEIVLAKNAFLYRGREEMNWNPFSTAIEWLKQRQAPADTTENAALSLKIERLRNVIHQRRRFHGLGPWTINQLNELLDISFLV